MIVPLCPICGHEMYFVGYAKSFDSTINTKRFACVHCDHVEDMICKENEDQEFIG